MQFDDIVIGGGSAGCVLAARLSEDPRRRVCLVEAGDDDRSWLFRVPLGAVAMVPRKLHNWAFDTVPQPGLGGRRGYQPRGKVLGGSSSINAMIYARGHRSDYDDWAALGNAGWSFDEVLPYFKRAENNERGADRWHGSGGPLNVADLRSEFSQAPQAFVRAAMQAGERENRDFNGEDQEGAGPYQVTQKNGRRWSAARAYLGPAAGRGNLTILTGAQALGLRMSGRRCTGVDVLHRGSRLELSASREVVLAAGAFGSPQLLMLSGIGPAQELARHGINPVHLLPGVGSGLRDHVDYTVAWDSDRRDVFGQSPGFVWSLLRGIGRFRREGRGVLTTNFAEAGAFLKTAPGLDRPDVQLHFVVAVVEDHARKLHGAHGFSCHACVLRPHSSGSVRLASTDPLAAPLIDPGFLGDDRDVATLLAGTRRMIEILGQPALAPWCSRSLRNEASLSDEALVALIRQRADTIYHPTSTCRMGVDEEAVVDPELRVRGLENLRVADASVMPTLIGGNTNAPTIMIAEKAADLIRGLPALRPERSAQPALVDG